MWDEIGTLPGHFTANFTAEECRDFGQQCLGAIWALRCCPFSPGPFLPLQPPPHFQLSIQSCHNPHPPGSVPTPTYPLPIQTLFQDSPSLLVFHCLHPFIIPRFCLLLLFPAQVLVEELVLSWKQWPGSFQKGAWQTWFICSLRLQTVKRTQ